MDYLKISKKEFEKMTLEEIDIIWDKLIEIYEQSLETLNQLEIIKDNKKLEQEKK